MPKPSSRSHGSVIGIEAAILAAAPQAQNEDDGARKLVAKLVMTDDDPPHLARFIGFQLLSDPRGVIEQPFRRYRARMLMETHQSDDALPVHCIFILPAAAAACLC